MFSILIISYNHESFLSIIFGGLVLTDFKKSVTLTYTDANFLSEILGSGTISINVFCGDRDVSVMQ